MFSPLAALRNWARNQVLQGVSDALVIVQTEGPEAPLMNVEDIRSRLQALPAPKEAEEEAPKKRK